MKMSGATSNAPYWLGVRYCGRLSGSIMGYATVPSARNRYSCVTETSGPAVQVKRNVPPASRGARSDWRLEFSRGKQRPETSPLSLHAHPAAGLPDGVDGWKAG